MTTQQPDLPHRSHQNLMSAAQDLPARPVRPMPPQGAPVRPAAPMQPPIPHPRPSNMPPHQLNAPPRPVASMAQGYPSPYPSAAGPMATPTPQSPMDALTSAAASMNLQTAAAPPPQQQNTVSMQQQPHRSTKPRRVYAPMTPPPSNDASQPYQYQQSPMQQQQQQLPRPTATTAPQPLPNQQQQQQVHPPRKQHRINPDHIPSPVQIRQQDQELYATEPYATCSQEPMPLATTDFKIIDQGNCNPRFMRTSFKELPRSYDMIRDTYLPFGIVVQPLAACHPEDEPVVVASTGPDGPVRCSRCKAYINPWCRFTDGGRKFMCNLCGFFNDVPEEYFSHLDMSGQRVDLAERPELQRGTIEFQVPQIYWTRQPCPLRVLFAIDVSWHAVRSGMLKSVCMALTQTLFDKEMSGTRVAIMTFDTAAHFYNINGEEAQMMVVPDINDVFLPISEDSLFVSPHEARNTIEALLSNLPQMFAENQTQTAALGSAVKAGLIGLKPTGGKVHVFQAVLPTVGPGALKSRDDPKLHNTEKERQLLAPQDTLYNVIGKECVELGVCVDFWLFPPPNMYIDVSTLGALPALTGGDTNYFAGFNPLNDEPTLVRRLLHSVTREQGYNAAMRVRCSNGFSVEDQYGNFYMNNSTDVEFGGIDADKAVAFTFRHDSRLDEKEGFIQCALLYTTKSGERRVRIHNLRLPVTSDITNLFKNADMDTTMNILCKQIISQASKRLQRELASQLDGECTRILAAYRKHCASSASSGQLILPEALKTLPVYASAFRKTPAFRKTMGSIDYKVYCMRSLKSMGVRDTVLCLYPRMISLDTYITDNGHQTSPPMERLSYERLRTNGIYYLQSFHISYIWIGRDVAPDTLQRILGTTNLNEKPSKVHSQLQTLLDQSPFAPLQYIRQGLDRELLFATELVEDEVYDEPTYVDYLCSIHRMIQSEMEREKRDNFVANASYWAYRY